jgi:thymidylate synthase
MQLFRGPDADSAWRKAVTALLTSGEVREQKSRAGDTRELLHTAFTIENPTQRWIVSRSPALNPALALVEAVWILSGRNDAGLLNFFNPLLPKYAGVGETYHGAYGYRLRRQFGVDQLDRAYHALLHNPDSRQVVLQIWDPRADLPTKKGMAAAQDIPCNVGSFLKIRDRKLEWLQMLRSNDIFLGVPYNFIQFTTLQEVVAGWLGAEMGTYVHVSDSLHIYTRDLSREIIRTPIEPKKNAESLQLSKSESDKVMAELAHSIDEATRTEGSRKGLQEILKHANLPQPYTNVLRVVIAEVCRRKKMLEVAQETMADCSNPILSQVWGQWLARHTN